MSFPQPSTPTLDLISTNDFINYQGVRYPVASVVSHTYTSPVIQTAVITITVSNQTVTLNLTSADTIVNEITIDQAGVQHVGWKQTAVYN